MNKHTERGKSVRWINRIRDDKDEEYEGIEEQKKT